VRHLVVSKRNILKTAIFVLVTLCFFAGAKMLYSNAIYVWNKAQLNDLAARSIIRTEYASDLAVTTMMDIQVAGLTDCSIKSMAAYRSYILSAGNIKNIHLATAAENCSGFATENTIAKQIVMRNWIKGKAPDIQFSTSPYDNKGVLRIRWQLNDFDLISVISIGGLLYDMVPSALRTHLGIVIQLSDGQEITSYQSDPANSDKLKNPNPEDQLIFKASSERYPIKANLRIDRATLWALKSSHASNINLVIALIGLVIGFLVTRVLFPPLGIEGDLDKAIANGEFQPHFQPIVSLHSHKIVGFEMLARWIKPDGKMISPNQFIPLAENYGRIDEILFSLLQHTGKQIGSELHKNSELKLTFNVTPEQFLDPTFLRRLLMVIARANLPLSNLVAEITERQELADLERAAKIVTKYRRMGIRVAIDDVGTGHNGLSSVQKLNANTMKLDKLFIDGIVYDERARQMVSMLSQLASQYQMSSVAEGLETAEQVAVALSLGIQEGQGFYFYRPLPADKLIEVLNCDNQRQSADITACHEVAGEKVALAG
jgi:EAL domain-containing protein (putative c-di-GMP-specific phosphodiesterase class I)